MKHISLKYLAAAGLAMAALGLPLSPSLVRGQFWPPPMQAPSTPDAQRNALNNLRSRVRWLKNATRTAYSYSDGAGPVWQQFQYLRGAFASFTMTLNARQLQYGANDIAELGAGLDIIQEAFANYQDDLNAGRLPAVALRDLCDVLNKAVDVWLQELNRDANRLRVGW